MLQKVFEIFDKLQNKYFYLRAIVLSARLFEFLVKVNLCMKPLI